MADNKLVGQNYTTPDLVAKVTGKAKYAEDFRADGMLFAKLLLSPMPHARVMRIDTSAALAMPGVKAILTADDLPGAGRHVTDLGETITANPTGERGADERAAVRRRADSRRRGGRRAHRGRGDREDSDRVRAAAVRRRSARQPASRRPERARRRATYWVPSGRRRRAGRAAAGAPPPPIEVDGTEVDRRTTSPRTTRASCRWASTPDEWTYGDVEAGFKKAALVLDETFVEPNTSHQPLEPRSAMAYWQNGKLYLHAGTQSTVQTVASIARWVGIDAEETSCSSASTPAAASAARRPATIVDGDSGAAVEEGERAGDDAHHARRGALHRPRASRRCTRASRSASARTAASPRSTSSSSPRTARTSSGGDARSAGDAWSRSAISRRRCGGAA